MKHKNVLIAVALTYVLMSFVPQIGLMHVIGKKPKG